MVQNSGPKDQPNLLRRGGFFLTETLDTTNTQRKPVFQRPKGSVKPEPSQRSARPPTERAVTQERVTFIPSNSLEENKSFNLVKCRQRLRDLTDSRLQSLLKKQEKHEKQLEKYYKEQKTKEKMRISLQLKKDEYRDMILTSYKNKLREMDDKSNNEYRSHVRGVSQKHLNSKKNLLLKNRKKTEDMQFYTHDYRRDEDEIRHSIEKYERRMHSAEKRSSERKEQVAQVARQFSEKVPLIQERFNKLQEEQEEQRQIEFIKLHRKNNSSYKRKEKLMKEIQYKHHMQLSMRIERSKSIKQTNDRDFNGWRSDLQDKYIKDLKRLDEKQEKLDHKAKVLKEVDKLRFSDMKSNFMREQYKSQLKKERLQDREYSDRERLRQMSFDKQKAIENQMEINRLVQQQAHLITFG